MKMTTIEKQERQKAIFTAGPVGVWICIGQKIGYAKALPLMLGMTALFVVIGSLYCIN